MKHDRSKYMPNVGQVLEDYNPATFDDRQHKALEKVKEAGLLERPTPEPAARVSAPSPWAKDGSRAEVDKAALPSAMAPAATGSEAQPVTTPAAVAEPEKVSKWSWKVVAGLAGFVLAVALVSMTALVGQMRDAARKAAATPSVMGAAVPSTTATEEEAAVPSTTATAAEPDAGAAHSLPQSSPRRRPIHPPTVAPPVATDILP